MLHNEDITAGTLHRDLFWEQFIAGQLMHLEMHSSDVLMLAHLAQQ